MIPKFPDFSSLEFVHRNELTTLISSYEPYSDFNFTSLLSWNFDGSARIATLNDNLVITLPDYLTGDPIYSLLGSNHIDDTLRQLFDITSELRLVPEIVTKNITHSINFRICEEPEHFDYIYSLEALALLPGQKYRGKRKSIYRFTREFDGSYEVKSLDLTDKSVMTEIENTFGQWARERGKIDEESSNEQRAISRLLQHANVFKLISLGIFMDGQMVGFSINEAIDNEFTICHFQKTILTYDGIDVFLTRETAKTLYSLGYLWANWEQDLGIDGLRELKLSYKPVRMLEKFTISRVT